MKFIQMKKLLLFAWVLASVAGGPLVAQETRPFTVGWQIGAERTGPVVLLDTAYFTSIESRRQVQQRKIAATGGLRLEALLGGNATIRLDILYADRGWRERVQFSLSNGPLQEENIAIRLGYLSLPLTLRLPFNQGPAFGYGAGGMVADRLLFASQSRGSFSGNDLAPWGFSWRLGLGASYPFSGESRGFFELLWTRGISDYRSGSSWQPESLGIVIGWMY